MERTVVGREAARTSVESVFDESANTCDGHGGLRGSRQFATAAGCLGRTVEADAQAFRLGGCAVWGERTSRPMRAGTITSFWMPLLMCLKSLLKLGILLALRVGSGDDETLSATEEARAEGYIELLPSL